ncbi:elongation factor P [bacterium]|nr:elongation factor P [bacterium]MBU1652156.1 elongation factor P [bacterium]MBU1881404.1 elongation factor P [bacterium]
MGSTADFRNGLVIKFRDELWQIVDFQHVKPGKGGAFVRTKMKSIKTGRVVDNTFRSGESVETIRMEEKKMQYLYQDGAHYVFMDQTTYDQVHVSAEIIGDNINYLKENEICSISFNGDTPLRFELPNFVIAEITETEPSAKGDTVTGGNKPAKIGTGASVNVPLFINIGDKIRIDTRSGAYMERVKE